MRKIKKEDVVFTVTAEYEHLPVEGNAIASGDESFDREVCKEIHDRLKNDDVWAWASVAVVGTYKGLSATSYLGGCSYENEKAFREDAYYDDMCTEVVEELNAQVSDIVAELL